MPTPKTSVAAKPATISRGTEIAAKYRARANLLSDAERQTHRAHAMNLIYGSTPAKPAHVRSR